MCLKTYGLHLQENGQTCLALCSRLSASRPAVRSDTWVSKVMTLTLNCDSFSSPSSFCLCSFTFTSWSYNTTVGWLEKNWSFVLEIFLSGILNVVKNIVVESVTNFVRFPVRFLLFYLMMTSTNPLPYFWDTQVFVQFFWSEYTLNISF